MHLKIKAALLAIALAAVGGAGPSSAQMQPGQPLVPLGYCQLTSLGSSTLLSTCSGGIPTGANVVILKAEAQALRWRDDGTAPTSSAGMPIATADAPFVYVGQPSKLRFIEQTSGGKLNAAFYRAP
jgi:hypothetical protein